MAAVIFALGALGALRSGRSVAAELARTLRLTLELLLAAGLLRLGALDTYSALGVVAVTIAVRQVIAFGLRLAVRVDTTAGPPSAPGVSGR